MLSQNLSFPLAAVGYNSYEYQIKVHEDPGNYSHYFWSCQFFMTNHMPGYMGLQTDTSSDGKYLGRGIRVGMADAIKVEYANSNEILSGISGKSIFLPYSWKATTTYQLSVCKSDKEGKGHWWQFALKDGDTHQTHLIGKFLLPFEEGLSHEIITRTEYLGPGSRTHFPKSGSAEFLQAVMISQERDHESISEPASSRFDRPKIAGCKIKRGTQRFSSLHQVTATVRTKSATHADLFSRESLRNLLIYLKMNGPKRSKALEY